MDSQICSDWKCHLFEDVLHGVGDKKGTDSNWWRSSETLKEGLQMGEGGNVWTPTMGGRVYFAWECEDICSDWGKMRNFYTESYVMRWEARVLLHNCITVMVYAWI